MSHLRYPEDLFKVQRALLGKYHVTDPKSFFTGGDFWQTPNDPTVTQKVAQPPYYLTLKMPDQEKATFSLTSTYIPFGTNARETLQGYMAVDADAGDQAGQPSKDYGKLRILALPRDSNVPGPGQVNNNFTTDPTVSNELNILGRGDSTVVRGNLLALPVGNGFLFVQPVYLQARTGTVFPLLQRVLVSFGDDIGFSDTLDGALDQVFGGDSGASAGDAGTNPGEGSGGSGTGSGSGSESGSGSGSGSGSTTSPDEAQARSDLDRALQQAQKAIQDSQAALASGDFTAYGNAQKALDNAVQEAVDAQARLGETSSSSSSGSTPSPTATSGG